MYFIVFLFIAMMITLLVTSISTKNRKLLKYEVIFFAVLFAIVIIYYGDYDRHVKIKSNLFPTKTHTIQYSKNNKIIIKLPPNSIWLHKIPDNDFYSKHSIKECKNYFELSLEELKDKDMIANYTYNKDKKMYNVAIDESNYFEIVLNSDESVVRFFITKSSSKTNTTSFNLTKNKVNSKHEQCSRQRPWDVNIGNYPHKKSRRKQDTKSHFSSAYKSFILVIRQRIHC